MITLTSSFTAPHSRRLQPPSLPISAVHLRSGAQSRHKIHRASHGHDIIATRPQIVRRRQQIFRSDPCASIRPCHRLRRPGAPIELIPIRRPITSQMRNEYTLYMRRKPTTRPKIKSPPSWLSTTQSLAGTKPGSPPAAHHVIPPRLITEFKRRPCEPPIHCRRTRSPSAFTMASAGAAPPLSKSCQAPSSAK